MISKIAKIQKDKFPKQKVTTRNQRTFLLKTTVNKVHLKNPPMIKLKEKVQLATILKRNPLTTLMSQKFLQLIAKYSKLPSTSSRRRLMTHRCNSSSQCIHKTLRRTRGLKRAIASNVFTNTLMRISAQRLIVIKRTTLNISDIVAVTMIQSLLI